MQLIFGTLFILQNWNSPPIKQLSVLPSLWPLVTTLLFSVSVNLCTLVTKYKWNKKVCVFVTGLFHLALNPQGSVMLQLMSVCSLRLSNIQLCIYHILFFISFLNGHVYLLTIVNNTTMNMSLQMPLQDPAFDSFGHILRSGVVGSWGNLTIAFSVFWRITVLTAVLFYSPTRIPVYLRPCWSTLFSVVVCVFK